MAPIVGGSATVLHKDLDRDGDIDTDDAKLMFDEDSADSDGDGVSNLLERAFGGDSLGPDDKPVKPRRMPTKADGKQRRSDERSLVKDGSIRWVHFT